MVALISKTKQYVFFQKDIPMVTILENITVRQ